MCHLSPPSRQVVGTLPRALTGSFSFSGLVLQKLFQSGVSGPPLLGQLWDISVTFPHPPLQPLSGTIWMLDVLDSSSNFSPTFHLLPSYSAFWKRSSTLSSNPSINPLHLCSKSSSWSPEFSNLLSLFCCFHTCLFGFRELTSLLTLLLETRPQKSRMLSGQARRPWSASSFPTFWGF